MANLIDVNVDSGGRLILSTTDATGQVVQIDQQELIKTLNAGGWIGAEGVEGSYQIVNYHFANDYVVSTTNGTVRVVNDMIYYTPALRGNGGFLVNGTFCAVTVSTSDPLKPSVTSPTYNDVAQSKTVALTTNAFSDADNTVTHTSTRWQIATDPAFTNLVMDVTSTTYLTSVQATGLDWGGTYYARARHIGTKP